MHFLRALLLVVLAAGSVTARSRPRRHRDRAAHPDSLLVAQHLPPSQGIAIRVEELDPEAIFLLDLTRPPGDRLLDVGHGMVELWTTSDGLVAWLHAFLAAARSSHQVVPMGRWSSLTLAMVRGGGNMRQETLWRLSRPDDETGRIQTLFTPEMLWKLRPQDDHDEMALLSWHRVQQALVRLTAAIEASTIDPRRRDRVADGVRVAARVHNWFEVGGGFRRIQAALTEGSRRGDVDDNLVLFVRAGIARDLNVERRFTIPVALDAGGGPAVAFHARLHTGVRIGLKYGRYIGIELFTPSYTRYRDSSPSRGNPRWSYRSSVEAGVTF